MGETGLGRLASCCGSLGSNKVGQSGTNWDKGSRREARIWERQGLECWGRAAACPAPWKVGGVVVTAVMGLSLEGNITLEMFLKESFRKTKSLSNILRGTRNYRVLV